MTNDSILPRLVVDDAETAIDFYVTALGAIEVARFVEPSGKIVHAEVRLGSDLIALTESDGAHNVSPTDLGGSPLLLSLTVDDADAVGDAMTAAGATVMIPIDDREYGRREGRLRDPAGHLWIISEQREDLSADEIAERLSG